MSKGKRQERLAGRKAGFNASYRIAPASILRTCGPVKRLLVVMWPSTEPRMLHCGQTDTPPLSQVEVI
ncbi:hypothetical protein, partial [Shewanella xiamenensis]